MRTRGGSPFRAGNKSARHIYDGRGREIETTWLKASGELWETHTRTYDDLGHLLSIAGTVSGIRVEYTYAPDAPAPDLREDSKGESDGAGGSSLP